MKTIKSAIKSVILAAIVAAVGVSSPVRAAQYAPRTATESVFFSYGYIQARIEGEDFYNRGLAEATAQGKSVANSPLNRSSFYTMAAVNDVIRRSFANANVKGEYDIIVAYFSGRVAAFLALAEAYGE